jgi:hypothetical protein
MLEYFVLELIALFDLTRFEGDPLDQILLPCCGLYLAVFALQFCPASLFSQPDFIVSASLMNWSVLPESVVLLFKNILSSSVMARMGAGISPPIRRWMVRARLIYAVVTLIVADSVWVADPTGAGKRVKLVGGSSLRPCLLGLRSGCQCPRFAGLPCHRATLFLLGEFCGWDLEFSTKSGRRLSSSFAMTGFCGQTNSMRLTITKPVLKMTWPRRLEKIAGLMNEELQYYADNSAPGELDLFARQPPMLGLCFAYPPIETLYLTLTPVDYNFLRAISGTSQTVVFIRRPAACACSTRNRQKTASSPKIRFCATPPRSRPPRRF